MMYSYSGFGDVPAKRTRLGTKPVDPSLATKYSAEQKAWCIQAVQNGLYPHAAACNQAVAAGAPMTAIAPLPGSEVAYDHTKLYVGIGIAVLVVGVGGYLLFK